MLLRAKVAAALEADTYQPGDLADITGADYFQEVLRKSERMRAEREAGAS